MGRGMPADLPLGVPDPLEATVRAIVATHVRIERSKVELAQLAEGIESAKESVHRSLELLGLLNTAHGRKRAACRGVCRFGSRVS
jgi:hypothetical protein